MTCSVTTTSKRALAPRCNRKRKGWPSTDAASSGGATVPADSLAMSQLAVGVAARLCLLSECLWVSAICERGCLLCRCPPEARACPAPPDGDAPWGLRARGRAVRPSRVAVGPARLRGCPAGWHWQPVPLFEQRHVNFFFPRTPARNDGITSPLHVHVS